MARLPGGKCTEAPAGLAAVRGCCRAPVSWVLDQWARGRDTSSEPDVNEGGAVTLGTVARGFECHFEYWSEFQMLQS